MFVRWAFLLLLGTVIVGCTGANDGDPRVEKNTDFDKNKTLFKEILKADQMILYEGLPHHDNESQLLAEEKRRKSTVALHGFPFYRETLEIRPDDKAKLQRLLGDESSFAPTYGVKLCGGFHPDYCVEWRLKNAVYRLLICFGCEEVNVYGPEFSLYCDLRRETTKELRETLQKYRKNRPSSKPSAQ